MSAIQPTLFISHGAPTMMVENSPTNAFLRTLGGQLSRPDLIIVASGHWETSRPALTASAQPGTIHDFYGFPPELYQLRYPAPGGGAWLQDIAGLFAAAGVPVQLDAQRGLDHGVWSPLMLLFPDADIPVVQLSLLQGQGAAAHFALGQVLRPLRDRNVLIIGSGGLTHNLRALNWRSPQAAPQEPARRFAGWMEQGLLNNRLDDVLHWDSRAPFPGENHPSDEHLMPLFVALGAAGGTGPADQPPQVSKIHGAVEYGALYLDSYRFD